MGDEKWALSHSVSWWSVVTPHGWRKMSTFRWRSVFHGFSWFQVGFSWFFSKMYPAKLYPGPMIQSRSAARRAAQDLVYKKKILRCVLSHYLLFEQEKKLYIRPKSPTPSADVRFVSSVLSSSWAVDWNQYCFLAGGPWLLPSSGELVWSEITYPHPTPPDRTHFLVWLLISSSNWSKLSMRGPSLFSGWYQMILHVFRCSQLFSDVLSCFQLGCNFYG